MRHNNISQKTLLSLLIVLLTLSMMPYVRASSSQTSWEAPLPYEDALLNQTLTTYKASTYGEVSLSANLYVLEKNPPGAGQYELQIVAVAVANSRYTMNYDIYYLPDGIEYPQDPNCLTLGDNEAAWVDMGICFEYYGAWYDKVFITSNGFVVLDERAYNDYGGKWTSPTPQSIFPCFSLSFP